MFAISSLKVHTASHWKCRAHYFPVLNMTGNTKSAQCHIGKAVLQGSKGNLSNIVLDRYTSTPKLCIFK